MESLAPRPTDHPTLTPFPLASEYPFAPWTDLGDRPGLHPVLRTIWDQMKHQFWYRGDPRANDLFYAIYQMSLQPSFRVGVRE